MKTKTFNLMNVSPPCTREQKSQTLQYYSYFAGQQRLAIRVPLVRLYQEVETFRLRAIKDMK